MFAILNKAKSNGLSLSCQIHLFQIIVIPILLYGCEIWGFENSEIMEKIQYDFCKYILKLNKKLLKYYNSQKLD